MNLEISEREYGIEHEPKKISCVCFVILRYLYVPPKTRKRLSPLGGSPTPTRATRSLEVQTSNMNTLSRAVPHTSTSCRYRHAPAGARGATGPYHRPFVLGGFVRAGARRRSGDERTRRPDPAQTRVPDRTESEPRSSSVRFFNLKLNLLNLTPRSTRDRRRETHPDRPSTRGAAGPAGPAPALCLVSCLVSVSL